MCGGSANSDGGSGGNSGDNAPLNIPPGNDKFPIHYAKDPVTHMTSSESIPAKYIPMKEAQELNKNEGPLQMARSVTIDKETNKITVANGRQREKYDIKDVKTYGFTIRNGDKYLIFKVK